jgi:hypothetical protein
MNKIIIHIEKNEDGYWGYSINEECITGGGVTIDDCKRSIIDCIDTIKMFDQPPSIFFKPYELIFLNK